MWKRIIFSIIVFYLLALFQASFLAHFTLWNTTLNLILVIVIISNLKESSDSPLGLITALIGGFFVDIFSSHPLGFSIFIFLLLSLFIKMIVKRYVKIPLLEKT